MMLYLLTRRQDVFIILKIFPKSKNILIYKKIWPLYIKAKIWPFPHKIKKPENKNPCNQRKLFPSEQPHTDPLKRLNTLKEPSFSDGSFAGNTQNKFIFVLPATLQRSHSRQITLLSYHLRIFYQHCKYKDNDHPFPPSFPMKPQTRL